MTRYVNCTGYADVWLHRGDREPIRCERGPVVWPSQEGADTHAEDGVTLTTGYEDFLCGLPEEEGGVVYLVAPEVQLVAGLLGRLDVWTWRYSDTHSGQIQVFGLVQRLDVGRLEIGVRATGGLEEGESADDESKPQHPF